MATDRVHDNPQGGVVAFVTNGGFIDGDAASGLRRELLREFHKVYCLNMRGTIRRGGFLPKARRAEEGDNIFRAGTTSGSAI